MTEHAMTAAEILWLGAGKPEVADVTSTNQPTAPCWWCGHAVGDRARPISSLPATFPAPQKAACPSSAWLCRACGWSLCEAVSLPASVAQERIRIKAEQGRRATVAIQGGKPDKRMILALDSGQIGVWSSPQGVSGIEGGKNTDGSPVSVAELRKAPVTFHGLSKGRLGERLFPCEFLGAFLITDLSDGASGGAGSEKFRSYHHFGTCSRWVPCTDADKAIMRQWILTPPDEPWAGMIYDAKKHGVVFTCASQGGWGMQNVFFMGENVNYVPAVLVRQVDAANALFAAGAREEEIRSGLYVGGSVALLMARQIHDRVLAPIRGSHTMELVLYLRMSRKELDGDGEGE